MLNMLETNGGCELPCWWGITPGQTRWNEMVSFFKQHKVDASDGQLWFNVAGCPLGIEFQRDMNQIQRITARIQAVGLCSPDFARLWRRYTLDQMLTRYGVPSEVYLSLVVGAGCIGSGIVPPYEIWVVYDDMGIAVNYWGQLIRDLDQWLVCPVFEPDQIVEIRLQAPGADTPLVTIEPENGDFVIAGTLSDVAGMNVSEFYESFRHPNPQVCARVPVSPSENRYSGVIQPPSSAFSSHAEEDAFLVQMLATNAGCELPCWWGITPGVTKWEDVQQMFLSYGKRIGHREWRIGRHEDGKPIALYEGYAHDVGLLGRHSQYPYDYIVAHTFYEQEGTVQLIHVIGHALGGRTMYHSGWPLSQNLIRDWERYALDQVLSRFGRPSQVLLHYWADQEGTLYYLGLVYEDRGILVTYVGDVRGENKDRQYGLDTVIICPARDQITDINLFLRSPNVSLAMADLFTDRELGRGYYIVPYSEGRSPSLEDATGMSLETFYQTFLDPNAQVCLQAKPELGDWFP